MPIPSHETRSVCSFILSTFVHLVFIVRLLSRFARFTPTLAACTSSLDSATTMCIAFYSSFHVLLRIVFIIIIIIVATSFNIFIIRIIIFLF